MKKIKKILFLLFFLIISKLTFSLNFSINPREFLVDFTQNETHELLIQNNLGRPLRLEIFFEDVKNKKSFGENIKIFPKKISIKPGGRGHVRFKIANLKDLESGEYDNLLIISEKEESFENFKTKDSGIKYEIKMITEIALHIYGIKI